MKKVYLGLLSIITLTELFGGASFGQDPGPIRTSSPRYEWREVALPSRMGHAAAWDGAHVITFGGHPLQGIGGQQTVLSGSNQTWFLEQTPDRAWTKVAQVDALNPPPPEVVGHCMALCGEGEAMPGLQVFEGKVLLFTSGVCDSSGPSDYCSTWIWERNATYPKGRWRYAQPNGPTVYPSFRAEVAMAYEPEEDNRGGIVILYLGDALDTGSNRYPTWIFDVENETWTGSAARLPGSTTPLRGHSMAYDPSSGKVVLFGGAETGANPQPPATDGNVYYWTGGASGSWALALAGSSGTPAPRLNHAMATLDRPRSASGEGVPQGVLMFAGQDDPSIGPASTIFSDTWLLRQVSGTWTWVKVADSSGACCYEDSSGNITCAVVASASTCEEPPYSGVFRGPGTECGSTGECLPISSTPGPELPAGRRRHAMAFDVNRGVVVLHGGDDLSSWSEGTNYRVFADTWEWDPSLRDLESPFGKWRFRNETPLASEYPQMFYDPVKKRSYMFGGYDLSETRVLVEAMVDDGNGGLEPGFVIVTGTKFPSDLWEWDGNLWKRRPNYPCTSGDYCMGDSGCPAILNPAVLDNPSFCLPDCCKDLVPGPWTKSQYCIPYDTFHQKAVLFGGVHSRLVEYSGNWVWQNVGKTTDIMEWSSAHMTWVGAGSPEGACCTLSGCVVTTEINCTNTLSGEWRGAGSTCVDNDGDAIADACQPDEDPGSSGAKREGSPYGRDRGAMIYMPNANPSLPGSLGLWGGDSIHYGVDQTWWEAKRDSNGYWIWTNADPFPGAPCADMNVLPPKPRLMEPTTNGYGLCYDIANQRVVLQYPELSYFSGAGFVLWIRENGCWERLLHHEARDYIPESNCAPTGVMERALQALIHDNGPAMVYDSKTGRTIVFGGTTLHGGSWVHDDLWSWDGTITSYTCGDPEVTNRIPIWEPETPVGVLREWPLMRTRFGYAYNSDTGTVLTFGGRSEGLSLHPVVAETWMLYPVGGACLCQTMVSDFNGDGDYGTDSDIEDFFACLAGNCCPTCQTADFNCDGDTGTDADIEAFFRVLAGGSC